MQRSQYTIEQLQDNDKLQRTSATTTTTRNDDDDAPTEGYRKLEPAVGNPQMSWRSRAFNTTTTTPAASKQNDDNALDSSEGGSALVGSGYSIQRGHSNNGSNSSNNYAHFNEGNNNNNNNSRNSNTATQSGSSFGSLNSNSNNNNNNNNSSNGSSSTNLTPLAQLLYSEDLRISKILRRLMSELNPVQAINLCKKLEIAVRNQSNTMYICRSFDFLIDNMISVLKQCPKECLEQASQILGLMGYINRSDFVLYKSCLMHAYQRTPDIQKYLMLALKTTLSCDAVNVDLTHYSDRLLQTLKDYLENSEQAENFIAISDTIGEFSLNYKRTFDQHFTDIVDIIVGWHLEIEQPQNLKQHCSQTLQKFSAYFLKNIDFTLGLLSQFLEDITGFGDEITASNTSKQQRVKLEQRIGAFIGAFNSILKSVATRNEFFESNEGVVNVVHEALAVVLKVTKQNFSHKLATEETILNVNDFLCLIIEHNVDIVDMQAIKTILELELQLCSQFNEAEQLSMLYMVLCIYRKLRTNLPKSLVTLVLQNLEESPNPLTMIKLAEQQRTYRLLLRIYHEILTIKNVPLLQEAYKHVVADIERCMASLKSNAADTSSYATRKSEALLSFYLAALSALATQTSSIISIYALSPSLLELFVVNYMAARVDLWSRYSTLHESVLRLLITHCSKNHNFRLTSNLLNEKELASFSSPTSEHFTMLLNFIANIMQRSEQLNVACLELLLDWLQYLLKACLVNADILAKQPQFQSICMALCGATTVTKAPLLAAACLSILIDYTELPVFIHEEIRNIALQKLDDVLVEVRSAYSELYAQLPLTVSLEPGLTDYEQHLQRQQQRYNANSNFLSYASLRQKSFKAMLEYLDPQRTPETNESANALSHMLLDYFRKSCSRPHSQQPEQHKQLLNYQKLAQQSHQLLMMWLQFEAARYCVQNKLRTIIGKPQETFLAIEGVIMKYARALSSTTKTAERIELIESNGNLSQLIGIQLKIRLLLGFLENLEKLIYNAAEGTAFAIAAAEKPAKTFFRINLPTCNEWFKRIRQAVCLIGLNSQQPEMVIRYAECLLQDKLSEPAMEPMLVSLVTALLQCSEYDTIQGLYARLKLHSKRFAWLQHAAEQAAGHQELAAVGYQQYLSDYAKQMDSRLKDFLQQQLLECLYYTGQWSVIRELENVDGLDVLSGSYKHLAKMEKLCEQYAAATEANDIMHKLTRWSEVVGDESSDDCAADGDNGVAQQLNNHKSCSIFNILRIAEGRVMSEVNGITVEPNDKHSLQWALQESLQLGPHSAFNDFLILNHVVKISSSGMPKLNANNGKSLLKCLLWSMELAQRRSDGDTTTSMLLLDVAAQSRAAGNLQFSQYLLQQFMRCKGYQAPLQHMVQQLQEQQLHIDTTDAHLMQGLLELAKLHLQQSAGSNLNENIDMSASVARLMFHQFGYKPQTKICAQLLLNMADNITQRPNANLGVQSTHLNELLQELPQLPVAQNDTVANIIPEADLAAGTLLNASVWQNEDIADNWYAFGNWCYRWGKKIIEPQTATEQQQGKLTARDIDDIKHLISNGSTLEQDTSSVLATLNKYQLNMNDGIEEISVTSAMQPYNSTEQLTEELRNLPVLANKPPELIANIIHIWRQAHKSIYSYYELATKAYFRYLAIKTEGQGFEHSKAHVEDSTFVTTTLRLLRLIVKHASGLQDVLEEGLNNTPLRPWKIIIPQLFSRLNHHEPYVRKCVSELLCRLASVHSHLILFPAIVGAQQQQKVIENSEANATRLSTCFSNLLQTLTAQAPDAVRHVQLLVRELKRITLLWEEYWLHGLSQIYADYSPILNAFEQECKKSKDYALERLEAKYKIIMQHVVADLEKLAAFTRRPAETNYERCFQERFTPFIDETIEALKAPFVRGKVTETWLKIKQLYNIFQQRSLRGSSSTLKVSELSPILANMSNTAIAMPGVDTNGGEMQLNIRSVDHLIHILPTKTKPKKLAFYGSNGRKYTYLFKGLEDLHLDERIMQFLAISNSMMARSAAQGQSNSLKAQHYSVIPLGPQSGMISWVDHVTPMFAIYKKWQQRDALLKQQQKERQPSKQTSNGEPLQNASITPTATRPSELFFNKLTPLLTAQRIKVTDPRKQWPLATLRQVYQELSAETPKDLLAKEIWCHSVNAAAWRQAVRNYSISVAVMSVIGYVIGLGDRHLDNVLIKLTTGEIVHIDYNVCFEKGKTLRIPEKVPFRMTQNLETALGITGVEGAFRISCEHVLKVLRKEKETLLTLLEAFVYDPLVDWTVNDHEGTTAGSNSTTSAPATNTARPTTAHIAAQELSKLNASYAAAVSSAASTISKDQSQLLKSSKYSFAPKKPDLEVARQNIIMRYNEVKPAWSKYKVTVLEHLEGINGDIEQLLDMRTKLQQIEKERDSFTKQLALIRELEALGSAMGSHSLNTLTQRYESYKANIEALRCVKENMQQQHENIKQLLQTYFNKLIASDSNDKLIYMQMRLNEEQQKALTNEFTLVADVLQQNEQTIELYENCVFARREMENSLYQETQALLECLQLLLQYSNIMQFYARKEVHNNALLHYEHAYEKLLQQDVTEDVLAMLIEKQQQQRAKLNGNHILAYADGMAAVWQQLNFNLELALNALNEHKQQMLLSLDYAGDAVQQFLYTNPPICAQQFRLSMLLRMNEAHIAFVAFEVNSTDFNLLLEQQMNFISMLFNILTLVYADLLQLESPALIVLISNFQCTLAALYKLKCSFELGLVERILHLFMLDDDAALQAQLSKACSADYLVDFFALMTTAGEVTPNVERGKFATLLCDISSMFGEFEGSLSDLLQASVQQLQCGENFDCSADAELTVCVPKHLKFEAIAALFKHVHQVASSLKHQHLDKIYDVRQFANAVGFSKYLAHIQQTKLIGFIGTIYTDLHATLSKSLPNPDVPLLFDDPAALSHIQMLCDNYFLAEQQSCLLKQQQREVLRCTKRLDHYTLVATAYYWQHTDCMPQHELSDYQHIISREQLLAKLLSNTQTLANWKHTITKVQSELDEHVLSIKLHLNWHNNNANDSEESADFKTTKATAVISKNFELVAQLQREHYDFHVEMLQQMCDYACVLLQFERYTAFGQQLEAEEVYQALLAQYQQAYNKWQQSDSAITAVERSIVELLDPEGKIDQCWIRNISALLDDMIFMTQKQIAQYEREQLVVLEQLQNAGQELQYLLDMPVRQDVRYLIKSIFKNEKNSRAIFQASNGDDQLSASAQIRDFHQAIKLFYSNIGDLRMKLLQRDVSELNLQQVKEQIQTLQQEVKENHQALVQAMQEFIENPYKAESTTQTPETLLNAATAGDTATDKKLSNSTGEQKRNAYAVSVWKRIRMKLEGRDPDSSRRSTVPEQIDYIIRESLNIDNLAVLYEGWTPWV